MIEFVGACAVGDRRERIIRRHHGVEVLPGVARSVPTALGHHPFLVHHGAPGLGDGGHERTPRLRQGHGDGTGSIVGYDSSLRLFAGSHELDGIRSRKSLSVIVQAAFGIDQQGDVIHADPEERLGQQPLRGGGSALQQAALERVGHIRRCQITTLVELHTAADVEGPRLAIRGDLRHRVGQQRNELVRGATIVEHQCLVDVLDGLAAGRVVGQGRVEGVVVTDGRIRDGVGVLSARSLAPRGVVLAREDRIDDPSLDPLLDERMARLIDERCARGEVEVQLIEPLVDHMAAQRIGYAHAFI